MGGKHRGHTESKPTMILKRLRDNQLAAPPPYFLPLDHTTTKIAVRVYRQHDGQQHTVPQIANRHPYLLVRRFAKSQIRLVLSRD